MKYSKGRLFIFLKQKSRLLLFFIGITASLMALKGANQYFSALIRLTKTKFLTPVTSNTEESHGLGGFGTGGGFFHSKGTWGCAAHKGILFRTSSLGKGILFGNSSRV